jgi:hypothetical protein
MITTPNLCEIVRVKEVCRALVTDSTRSKEPIAIFEENGKFTIPALIENKIAVTQRSSADVPAGSVGILQAREAPPGPPPQDSDILKDLDVT